MEQVQVPHILTLKYAPNIHILYIIYNMYIYNMFVLTLRIEYSWPL